LSKRGGVREIEGFEEVFETRDRLFPQSMGWLDGVNTCIGGKTEVREREGGGREEGGRRDGRSREEIER
jgi:hypothetical protein